jgi:hypothetical protein
MTLSPPQPSVLHLLTIFRQISAGEIRIPAFQREFVWKEKQIIELLESVRAGYPVGSILLWYVEKPILKVALTSNTAFPTVSDKYPTSYILDGMQRLSSLYGVFHYGSSTTEAKFNVWYNLKDGSFAQEEDIQTDQADFAIPLAALFVPRALLSHQGRLSKLSDSDALIESLVNLQSAFQDYMIPVVQIRGEDIAPIVTIFEKINSTGTALSKVDFMRAITWAQDFDLSRSVDDTQLWLEHRGFSLNEETVIKCIGMLLDIEPTVDALLNLRNKSSKELHAAFDKFQYCFDRTASFLRKSMSIFSASYIPYEGQILVVFRAVGMNDAVTASETSDLTRWLWATSFNESLRGKPDHYVTRAIVDWRALISGRIRGLETRLRITAVDFSERRLIRAKALSTAFAAMFATFRARSLWNEEHLDHRSFMLDWDASVFRPVLTAAELALAGIQPGASTKVFANIVLCPEFDRKSEQENSLQRQILLLREAKNFKVLESQFIDEEAATCLEVSDFTGFIERRSFLLWSAAKRLVEC